MTATTCTRCHVTIPADKIGTPGRCPDPKCPTMAPVIPGTFTHIDMKVSSGETLHPLAKAQAMMVGELARLVAPKLSANPEPEDFEDVADYLLRGARIIDEWIKEVGLEVRSASIGNVDINDFTDVLKNAVEGFATYEIDTAAEAVRDERQEIESALRHRRSASAMIEDIYRAVGMPKRS